jgi:NADP-dependent 3-hydroxy acid dehydrogenase YdfG
MSKTIIFGTSGIGGAVARLLVAEGRPVHLVGRNKNLLLAQAEELGATFSVCDVTQGAEGIDKAVSEAGESLAGLCYSIGKCVVAESCRAGLMSRA